MTNPLLNIDGLPIFSEVTPKQVEPALDEILADNRAKIAELLKQKTFTWENLLRPIEALDDRLHKMWTVVEYLHAVMSTNALRKAYNACLPKLSDYAIELAQNTQLHDAIKSIANSDNFKKLECVQQKIIEDTLRDFHLAGVDLPKDKKEQFKKLQSELSQLTSKFEENVLDATQAWHKLITDDAELSGLPEIAIATAKQAAEQHQQKGWRFGLDQPAVHAILTYANSRELRKEVYTAYVTRASDKGPNAGKYDNSEAMRNILKLRKAISALLGFKNYAERSLATKMVKEPTQVLAFLEELTQHSLKQAKQEYAELEKFTKGEKLEAWDIGYYSEKLRKQRYDISQNELRPYFAEDQVLHGMFSLIKKLYGMTVDEVFVFDRWHDDVRLFTITDKNNQLRGQFYTDLYARQNKRGGAWMNDCHTRRQLETAGIQTPVAFVTCNFNPPIGDQPGLLNHDEVLTLFHEFGHALHHLLTQVDYADASGLNGVPWDAVELPSQFMENWCWQKDVINNISKHYKTGEKLPDELFNKLIAAKNFQSAMCMMRQLEFALFDFRLHVEFDDAQDHQIQKLLNDVRKQVSVAPTTEFNRFQHSFSHIFAGGYAAGYYSYKWAEVMSSDAFAKFEENGLFSEHVGNDFLKNILEKGGSEDIALLYKNFRGKAPTVDALLRYSGINT